MISGSNLITTAARDNESARWAGPSARDLNALRISRTRSLGRRNRSNQRAPLFSELSSPGPLTGAFLAGSARWSGGRLKLVHFVVSAPPPPNVRPGDGDRHGLGS